MSKQNCWEFKKCGREPGGHNAEELGVCPTPLNTKLDGMHGGHNGGRSCWVVAGSMCGGKIQGTFVEKYDNCSECEFYNQVKKEEQSNFSLLTTLLRSLKAF